MRYPNRVPILAVPPEASLAAAIRWFHMFDSMIDSELGKISGSALKVYLVIKRHSNYQNGLSFPSEKTIAEKAVLSISQVKRCVKELHAQGYLSVTKHGRKNLYMLREKILIQDNKGNSTAEVTWDYVPSAVTNAVEEIKNYVKTGQAEKVQIIQIQNLQLNINNVSGGGVVINNQTWDLSKFDPEMQRLVRGFLANAGITIPENYTQLTDDTCRG